jgi:hypothetical protein
MLDFDVSIEPRDDASTDQARSANAATGWSAT